MHISVKWFNDQFNVNLHSKEGEPEFLSIKGCRIKSHEGKEFVAFPSTKNAQTGKWWPHAWASDKFQVAVIEAAKKAQQPPKSARDLSDIDDDIPFDNPYRGIRSYVV